MESWFVVRTKANAEKKVHERLLALEVDSFLPLYTTLRQWSDRKKKVQVPYIPGHVFVRCLPKDLVQVYNVSGISHVLSEFGKPAVVRDVEISNLRILCEQESWSTVELATKLEKGTEVEVLAGPFKGLFGIVVKDGKSSRVHLNFDQLGMSVVVNIDKLKVIE